MDSDEKDENTSDAIINETEQSETVNDDVELNENEHKTPDPENDNSITAPNATDIQDESRSEYGEHLQITENDFSVNEEENREGTKDLNTDTSEIVADVVRSDESETLVEQAHNETDNDNVTFEVSETAVSDGEGVKKSEEDNTMAEDNSEEESKPEIKIMEEDTTENDNKTEDQNDVEDENSKVDNLDDITEVTEDVRVDEITEGVRVDEITEDVKVEEGTEDVRVDEITEDVRVDEITEDVKVDEGTEGVRVDEVTEDVRVDEVTEDVGVDEVTVDLSVNEDAVIKSEQINEEMEENLTERVVELNEIVETVETKEAESEAKEDDNSIVRENTVSYLDDVQESNRDLEIIENNERDDEKVDEIVVANTVDPDEKSTVQTLADSSNEIKVKKMEQNFPSDFITVHIQLDDGSIKNQLVTITKSKVKKPYLGGFRHKVTGIKYLNAAVQTIPRPRPPPAVLLLSRDTQTFQMKHQKINTENTTSSQMTRPGVYVANVTDKLLTPGTYVTAEEHGQSVLDNVIIIQKYYRRWLAKKIVDEKRRQRDTRLEWEEDEKERKHKEKEERIRREHQRRMHPKTKADFDLLYNDLERWRQERLTEIDNSEMSEAEKKAEKARLLDDETDLLAAIDRHKLDRRNESQSEAVQKMLTKAATPKSWKDAKGRKIQMDTPYTIRSRELLDILNSLSMQYLTPDERLDVLLTVKHTVKEHDCKLTKDIVELIDREADLIMRSVKDASLAGLRKRILTLFLQYCKTPTFNPEISLLLKVPPDSSALIGDINYCKYCARYLRSVEFSLSTKSKKLTICKACARKDNQSRNRQDYSHYRRMLKELQLEEQRINDNSKIIFIFKQNDIKTLLESVWDGKSVLSGYEELDELSFIRWNMSEHWSPWNTVLLTKDEAEVHRKINSLSDTYSNALINRINQKHVIARNIFGSLERMIEKVDQQQHIKQTIKT